ncbi:Delta(14)-sterol reductase [Citrus sinensis]|uniref:Delta(14)-sterol reductase n=1 Tax=Citrus sinensis TaxID=2711 RepID=A0ACB8K1A9_CITSI|nr:Delta(14)-sterol reductase [Citrus sinensis]
MDLGFLLHAIIPSVDSAAILITFLTYLAIAGSILPGKVVPGAVLQDGTRLHYRCNGLFALTLLVALLGFGAYMNFISATVISDRGFELLSTTFIFSVLVTSALYVAGCRSRNKSSSLKPHVTGNLIHDWWFGIQLNPQFMAIDLKSLHVICSFYVLFCLYSLFPPLSQAYILDYFIYEEYMTSTWDIIAERLGFMLVFGDLVWIPFTFSIQAR